MSNTINSRAGSALVLGCDSRSGLTVVRSLGRAGLAVDIGWLDKGSLADRSRYVRAVVELPAYDPADRSPEPAWKTALIDLVSKQGYDLVIPCNDPAIIPLQIYADELARHGRFYTLGRRAFLASFDKYETYRLAGMLNIPTPPWVRVETAPDLASVGSDWQLPLVLKPLSSFDMARPVGGKRMVRKLYNRDLLAKTASEMLNDGPLLIQANFSGRGAGVEVIAREGHVLCAFQHERVHEPPHGGGSSYRRSVPLDPRLENATVRLVEALDYTGVMQAEFRIDGSTGRWILVEINGRFWGSLPLAVAAGMDFPLGLYQVLVEDCRELPREYRTGIYSRNLGLDIGWFFKNLRSDRNDPTLQTRKLWQVAAEIRHLLTLTERSDLFVLDDPKPGLAEIQGLAAEARRRVVAAIGRRLRRTGLAKRQAFRRLHTQAPMAHSILFVCKGNICRSPFAAEYSRRILRERVAVVSAGYYPQALRRSPDEAVAAAARAGIDLSDHRSAVLDRQMIDAADLIFVFDDENHERVLQDFPHAAKRVFFVGSLIDGRDRAKADLSIPDPWGGDAATFDQCYVLIRAALDHLMKALHPDDDVSASVTASQFYGTIGAEHRTETHQIRAEHRTKAHQE